MSDHLVELWKKSDFTPQNKSPKLNFTPEIKIRKWTFSPEKPDFKIANGADVNPVHPQACPQQITAGVFFVQSIYQVIESEMFENSAKNRWYFEEKNSFIQTKPRH